MSPCEADLIHSGPFAGPACFSGTDLLQSLAPTCVAWVALGANLGEPAQALSRAAAGIAALPWTRHLVASSLYRTRPVDSAGPDYTNAVIAVQTALGPLELLHALQRLEWQQGRERPYRNAPRTLDLDLIWMGGHTRDSVELNLPHPRYLQRAFVIEPLAEAVQALAVAAGKAGDCPTNWAPPLPETAQRQALSQAQGIEKSAEIWCAGANNA
jgi:2-amino-4-hydroxy-6-hydroxymethyldihydropteridine diphosphokinase